MLPARFPGVLGHDWLPMKILKRLLFHLGICKVAETCRSGKKCMLRCSLRGVPKLDTICDMQKDHKHVSLISRFYTPRCLYNFRAFSFVAQLSVSRRFRSLKLWITIRTYGLEKIRELLRLHIHLAQELASLIRKDLRWAWTSGRRWV